MDNTSHVRKVEGTIQPATVLALAQRNSIPLSVWNDASRTAPMADYVISVAVEGRDDGVVALGLAGAEAEASPEFFAPWFERARAEGGGPSLDRLWPGSLGH